MGNITPGWDRRRDVRFPTAERICWRRVSSRRSAWGWLSDTSRSSVSFVAPSGESPGTGEEIVLAGRDGAADRYRVTRIASYDDVLALVACRRSK